MKKHLVFAALVAGLLLSIVGYIVYQETILMSGNTVILETRPIDPRDLFRGEYVILRYAIETDELVVEATKGVTSGDALYVLLETNTDGVATVIAAQSQKPDFSSGTWLTGEVSQNSVRFPVLEQFYVPEGAGLPIERMRTDLHVTVIIHEGKGRVVGLLDENLAELDPNSFLE